MDYTKLTKISDSFVKEAEVELPKPDKDGIIKVEAKDITGALEDALRCHGYVLMPKGAVSDEEGNDTASYFKKRERHKCCKGKVTDNTEVNLTVKGEEIGTDENGNKLVNTDSGIVKVDKDGKVVGEKVEDAAEGEYSEDVDLTEVGEDAVSAKESGEDKADAEVTNVTPQNIYDLYVEGSVSIARGVATADDIKSVVLDMWTKAGLPNDVTIEVDDNTSSDTIKIYTTEITNTNND